MRRESCLFNLIVKGNGWGEGRDTFPGSRIFEYTEQSLTDRFRAGGQLDLAALIQLPTIFVQETFWEGDQIARVGMIMRANFSGRCCT